MMMRLALAVSNAVIVGGLGNWWAGMAAALATSAVHVVYLRNRPGPVTSWRHGAMAERRTGRVLAALDPGKFRVLHDRALPGLPATNLDHLVVGLTGVYAISSRRWTLGIRLWSDHRRLWAGSRPVVNLQVAVVRAAHTVGELLADELGHELSVSPVVAVHGARVPRGGLRFGGVVFQRARRLPRLLDAHPVVLTSAQVTMITAAAERAFPPMLDHREQGLSPRRTIA
ncbi:nuclease-related domain-containing protein [Actinomadura alba]|uniref:NERD domain-containing protein n=1 Tax=Actinomadura alba TaxID=406431 RepID=A0ABR7LT29_9ACTN|nr:nuclease-related domain-containing protein [Actinomadura alba]MBC6468001.1 NERD domain-containing protein [Actinomadura alba]